MHIRINIPVGMNMFRVPIFFQSHSLPTAPWWWFLVRKRVVEVVLKPEVEVEESSFANFSPPLLQKRCFSTQVHGLFQSISAVTAVFYDYFWFGNIVIE